MPGAEPSPHQRAEDVEQADEPDRPAAELERRHRDAERRRPTPLSRLGRQVRPTKATWKPQTKKPEVRSQKLRLRRPRRAPRGSSAPARTRSRQRAAAVLAQTERQREHDDRAERQHQHGQVPVAEPLLQERRDRHHRELSERAAGGRDAERDRALFRAGVWRVIAPKIGPKPAAAMPTPVRALPSVRRTPSVAAAIISMPATSAAPPAATVRAVPKRSATLPTKGDSTPIKSIDSALPNDHSSRPTLRSSAIGFWKLRADPDRQDHGAADDRHPEAARRSGVRRSRLHAYSEAVRQRGVRKRSLVRPV